jgi:nucleotide-binding universal stress UspA family protein
VSAPAQPRRVRRVLVALDASPHSLAALQAAVDLAGSHHLELVALFVEDLRLLQATALPFAREVGTFSGVARPLGLPETERRFQHLARRVEALVAAAAGRAEVASWSFRVRRGEVASEILASLEPDDLLSVGAAGWSPLRARGLGETARRLLHLAHGPVLLARHGTRLHLPLLVLLEGNAWRDALALAVALAGPAAAGLVLAIAPGREQGAREEEAKALLMRLGAQPSRARLLAGAGPAALRAVIRREGAGALLLLADATVLQGPAGDQLLASVEVPVVVVHAPPTDEPAAASAPEGAPGGGPNDHEKSPLV